MNTSVTTTVSQFTRSGAKVLVQNLGPGKLYISFATDVSATNGIQLDVFDAVELPGATFGNIFMVSDSTADVRMLGGVALPASAPAAQESISAFFDGLTSLSLSEGSASAYIYNGITLSTAPTEDVNYSITFTSAEQSNISYGVNPLTGVISAGATQGIAGLFLDYFGSLQSFDIVADVTLSSADTRFDGVTAQKTITVVQPVATYSGQNGHLIEGGSSVSLRWNVNIAPDSDVTVSYTSSTPELSFTSGTILAGTTGQVTVGTVSLSSNGIDDNVLDLQATTSSADLDWDGLTFSIEGLDNPVAVASHPFAGTNPIALVQPYITSSGSDSLYSVALAYTPTADVVLVATSDDPDFTVSPSTFTFTTGNFATPQPVTYSYVGTSTNFEQATITWTVDATSTDTSRVGQTDQQKASYEPGA